MSTKEASRAKSAKAKVVNLATKLYGARAVVEERKSALDAAGREAEKVRREARRVRLEELKPLIATEFMVREKLVAVAETCVSKGQVVELLKTVLEQYKVIKSAIAERKKLWEEGQKDSGGLIRRCSVGKRLDLSGIPMISNEASGDTWEEVLEKLQAKAKGGA